MKEKNKNKIIWVDIGTHLAQEYKSIFSNSFYFYWKIFRRLIGSKFLKRGNFFSLSEFFQLIKTRNHLKKEKDNFHFTFVEANHNIIKSNIYSQANDVFCMAIGKGSLDITRLFHVNNDLTSQGNSIYDNKSSIDKNRFTTCIKIDAQIFAQLYKKYLCTRYSSFNIILRLNCEGSEDDAIYAFKKTFGKSLLQVFGSLKDVKNIKGEESYKNLENFLKKNSISFTNFSPSVETWKKAFETLNLNVKKLL